MSETGIEFDKVTFAMMLIPLLVICGLGYVFLVPMLEYAQWYQDRELQGLPTTGTYTGTLSICHVEHPQSGGTTYLTFIDGKEFTMNDIYELQSGQNYTVTYNLYNNYASEVKLTQ